MNGKKYEIEMDTIQLSKGRVLYDMSDTSMCMSVSSEFAEVFKKFEELVLHEIQHPTVPYKSPITESPLGHSIRLSYNNKTDMFGTADTPINYVAKDTYVRTIISFRISVSKIAYKIVPDIVQLQIAPNPKPEEWMGD